jgi:hypothetical protein
LKTAGDAVALLVESRVCEDGVLVAGDDGVAVAELRDYGREMLRDCLFDQGRF